MECQYSIINMVEVSGSLPGQLIIVKLEKHSGTSVEFNNLLTSQVKKEIIKVGHGYRLRKMLVTRSTKDNNPPTIYFGFIETKKGYRLYEIGHHWFKDCCK